MEDNKPAVVIRKATEEDLPALLVAAEEFWKEHPLSSMGAFDKDNASRFIASLISLDPNTGYLLVATDNNDIIGYLACITTPPTVMTGRVATEVSWWVKNEYRKSGAGMSLLNSFEQWCKLTGHSLVQIELPGKESKALMKHGYVPVGTVYMKKIQ